MVPDAQPLWTTVPQAIAVALAYGWFAAASVALTRIDLRTHRLPDRIVAPSYLAGIACFAVASVLGVAWQRFVWAVAAMVALFLFYLMLRIISRSGIGGGDVKLAGLVGLHLGWLGLTPVVLGAVAAFLLGGGYAVILLVSRRATRHTRIPFGPFMLAGAWIAIALDTLLGGFG